MSSERIGNISSSYSIQHGQQMQQQQHNSQAPDYCKTTDQSSNSDNSNVYLALLGLAESFQQAGKYNLCIHCLESMFIMMKQEKQSPGFHFQLKVRLNLCRLYLRHSIGNNETVNSHLEKSVFILIIYCK